MEVEVTHGQGWGCDPQAWDRAWGREGDILCPNRYQATVPEPYQAGDCPRWVWATSWSEVAGHEPGPLCVVGTCGR